MEEVTKEQLIVKRDEVDAAYAKFVESQPSAAYGLSTEQKVDAEIAMLTARNAWLTKQEEYATLLDRYVHQESSKADDPEDSFKVAFSENRGTSPDDVASDYQKRQDEI